MRIDWHLHFYTHAFIDIEALAIRIILSAVPLPRRPILQLQLCENITLCIACDFEAGVQVEHSGAGQVDVLLFAGVAADGALELA